MSDDARNVKIRDLSTGHTLEMPLSATWLQVQLEMHERWQIDLRKRWQVWHRELGIPIEVNHDTPLQVLPRCSEGQVVEAEPVTTELEEAMQPVSDGLHIVNGEDGAPREWSFWVDGQRVAHLVVDYATATGKFSRSTYVRPTRRSHRGSYETHYEYRDGIEYMRPDDMPEFQHPTSFAAWLQRMREAFENVEADEIRAEDPP
jgi:hypothetical protein